MGRRKLTSPFTGTPLTRHDAEQLAGVLKVLADPSRLQILSFMASTPGEVFGAELCVGLAISQPTISHHLTILGAAGLVESRKAGTAVYHRIAVDAIAELAALLTPPPAPIPDAER
jgi:ArsR family transcriptional regulator